MRIALSVLVAFALTAAVHAEDTVVLRMYDLSDLLVGMRDFAPHPLGLQPVGGNAILKTAAADPTRNETPTLDGLLTEHFDPGMATMIREHSTLRGGTTLFLNGPSALHTHVEHVLTQVRRQRDTQVTVNVRLYLMSPHLRQSRYALNGLGWKALPERPGQAVAELTAMEIRMVMETLGKDDAGVECITSPSITTFAGQLAHTSFIKQQAYKSVAFAPQTGTAAISVLSLGDTLALRATPTADHLFIDLDLDHTHCALLEMKEIDLGPAGKAEAPVLWSGGERIRRSIAVGHGLIIATGVYLNGKQPRAGFLVVSPDLIEPNQIPAQSEKPKEPVRPPVAKPVEPKEPTPPPAPKTKGADNF